MKIFSKSSKAEVRVTNSGPVGAPSALPAPACRCSRARFARGVFWGANHLSNPKPESKIFGEREGGALHSSFDNPPNAGAHIADWVAETLRGHTAVAGRTN
jgi:hypothetical protein